MAKSEGSIKSSVDTSEIDLAIENMNRLVALLKDAEKSCCKVNYIPKTRDDEKMLVPKKQWDELEKRVQALEAGENIIVTAEHGNRSVRWYIRMLSHFTKADASKLLASWGN